MPDIDDIQRRMMDAADRAAHAAALDLQGVATRRAPVEEGTLRGSFRTDREEVPGGADFVVSANTPYAARQETELEWHHPLGGQARYMGQSLQEMAGRYEQIIAAAVAAELEG